MNDELKLESLEGAPAPVGESCAVPHALLRVLNAAGIAVKGGDDPADVAADLIGMLLTQNASLRKALDDAQTRMREVPLVSERKNAFRVFHPVVAEMPDDNSEIGEIRKRDCIRVVNWLKTSKL